MKNTDDLTLVKEILTHKIELKVQGIRKQKERNKFYRQKNISKMFYRELINKQMNVQKHPTKDELKILCESIWRIEKNYKEKWNDSKEKKKEMKK